MTQRLDQLQAAIEARFSGQFADQIVNFKRERGEITLTVSAANYLAVADALCNEPTLKFEQLIDLCSLDYSSYRDQAWEGPRYGVVSHLLSITHNWRVRLKVFAPDDAVPVVDSLTALWSSADWFEREAFDMMGIIFDGHNDLRRILTDYGFIGHPMRKDFPVSGHVEMRYDPVQKRVVYEPVTIEPREVTPRIIREDHYGGLH